MTAVVDDPRGGRYGQAEAMLQPGRFSPDALDLPEGRQLQRRARQRGERDLPVRVDGFRALGPNWKSHADRLQPPGAPAAAGER